MITELRGNYEDEYFILQKEFLYNVVEKYGNVTIDLGNNYSYLRPDELLNIINNENKPDICNICSVLEIPKNFDCEKYLVFNTKVVSCIDTDIKEIWNCNKDNICKIINDSDTKVVLIGERTFKDCFEYSTHNTFSIYNCLIEKIEKNKLLDMTCKEITDLYSMEMIKRNIDILSGSKFNIHFGDGGGVRVYAYINNLLMFTNNQNSISSMKYFNSPFFLKQTYDITDFLNSIKNNVCDKLHD